jgi:uncharacterized Zn finger protein (UPF0148 family)
MKAANIRPQGMPCPECSMRIVIDIMQLLSTGSIVCPSCDLELKVDQQKSAESLDIVKQVQGNFDQAQTQFSEAQYGAETVTKRTRGRRTSSRRRSRHD